MTRTVHCRKYQTELPGLDRVPFPGPKGEALYADISQKAWNEWIAHQTTLINEMRLNMMDLTARTYLTEQREKFFAGEEFDRAEGYVPKTE
jgi:Fe-S cluster biosynthesis and repair protein YggX